MAQITSNGTYGPYKWVRGGGGTMVTSGTFDSATVKLQYSMDQGVTKTDYPGISQTAEGVMPFNITENLWLYVNVAGGGGSMDFFLQVNESEGANNLATLTGSGLAQQSTLSLMETEQTDQGTTLDSILVDSASINTTASSVLTRLQAIRAGDAAERVETEDAGPADPTGVNLYTLKGASLGGALTLFAAPGASTFNQVRDLYVSTDTDTAASLYSGSTTLWAGELKAANGSIQLTPREGFTGEDNTSVQFITAESAATGYITAHSKDVT